VIARQEVNMANCLLVLIAMNFWALVSSQPLYTSVVSYLSGGSTYGYTDGPATSSKYYYPYHIDMFNDGQNVLVADSYNSRIRQVNVLTGTSTTILGSDYADVDAIGTSASFLFPVAAVLSNDETYALISDYDSL
jgi:hypothetical protein